MFTRLALACLVAVAVPLGGCIHIPVQTGPVVVVPTTAAISQLTLVVPLPDNSPRIAANISTPWHKARLTIEKADGTVPEVVQTLDGRRGGLRARSPLAGFQPGAAYMLGVELIQELANGNELVVARGGLERGEEAIFTPGANALRLVVQPTVPGAIIALSPVARYEPEPSYGSSNVVIYGNAPRPIPRDDNYETDSIYDHSEEPPADDEEDFWSFIDSDSDDSGDEDSDYETSVSDKDDSDDKTSEKRHFILVDAG